MTTVQDFLSSNEITGVPTPEQAAQLLELPQGDTASAEQADPPVSAPAPEPSPAAAETNATQTDDADLSADNAVILAKDGKHTIPFDKLQEARESAQQAAAERDAAVRRAAELQAQLEAAQRPAEAPAPQAESSVDLKTLRAEHIAALVSGDDDKALELAEKIDAEVQRLAEERIMQRLAADRAKDHATAAAATLQQTAESLKSKYPALNETSPNADPEAIDFVVYKRDALIAAGELPHKALEQAVEKAASLFKWNGQPAAAQPAQRDAAAAAAAAIAAAKAPTPATLSDIPGGKPAGLSLDAQMATKSGPEMLEVMQNMTRDQIEDYLNRTI